MTLRDSARSGRVPSEPRMPLSPHVEEQERVLLEKFDASNSLAPEDAEELIGRLRSLSAGAQWSGISFRDWKRAVWVLFGGDDALASHGEFLDRLIFEYRSRDNPSAYRGLILAYLRDFDPHSAPIRRSGDEIARIVNQFQWPWTARESKYQLFARSAPAGLTAACLKSNDPFEVLNDAGLGGPRVTGGFAASAYEQALEVLRDLLSRKEPNFTLLDRVLRWSKSRDGLTYPKHRARLATALLAPWSVNTPPEDQREKISKFLLTHFRDPRLPKNAKDWLGVEDGAIAVLRKWLTGVALEQFFEVVDQVAQESMWRYRRAFWLAYHEKDTISDAWVLFGPDAQTYAKRAFGQAQSYGILDRRMIQPDHSVLLMKIGKLVVADWSHNGKCHIWRDGNENAPKLYLGNYHRADLIHESDNGGMIHHSSEYGTWQRKVAQYIRRNANISVSENEYMPSERRY